MIPTESLPPLAAGSRLGLLRGTRVLDLTTSIAGPYATMLLGDFGAEVIKVERPNIGDDSRHWGPPSYAGHALWFLSVNRNKKSLTLDFSVEAGRRILHDLIRHCDVIVTNQLPRVQRKLGIDIETVRALRPDIVYVSISGFGMAGARSEWPCYDLIAEGYSGVMDLTGEPDSGPQKVGTPAADLLAGGDAAMGCLAALVDRARTGAGHVVEISLVESMTRFMTPRVVSYLGGGELPRRSGARDSVIAIYQVFMTEDDPITLGLPNENIWRRFCAAVERNDWLEEDKYKGNAARVSVRAELAGEIQKILLRKGRTHWLDLFSATQIPAGPINRVDQVVEDPELLARGLFYSMAVEDQRIPQVGLGMRFDDQVAGYDRVPPSLGQDTDAILTQLLGCEQDEITRLRAEGVL
ncbi:CaiB/BaiF CoA transferase family protein [Ancylobacter polymorphus]|uniref:CoA transferase n=1 Tax=Ancylobacter polymorphus TaxID=223390 RepID=A0A9E7A534_9HYPH|nr:CoA transferase [Ancylobacter polymorphus]UOK73315.1 CoA transferase [Ancylobacter polymorphus]